MAMLPWALIPVFLVPQLIVGHFVVYRRLGGLTVNLQPQKETTPLLKPAGLR
jgi:hypothetical protein